MNLVAIKKRYSDFISSFDPNDLQLLMYFTELVLEKYNDSPTKLLEYLDIPSRPDACKPANSCLNETPCHTNQCFLTQSSPLSAKEDSTNDNEDAPSFSLSALNVKCDSADNDNSIIEIDHTLSQSPVKFKIKATPKANKFKCNICGHLCNSHAAVYYHLQKKHNADPCNQMYTVLVLVSTSGKHKHEKLVPKEQLAAPKRFKCGSCAYRCTHKGSIIYHLKNKHGFTQLSKDLFFTLTDKEALAHKLTTPKRETKINSTC